MFKQFLSSVASTSFQLCSCLWIEQIVYDYFAHDPITSKNLLTEVKKCFNQDKFMFFVIFRKSYVALYCTCADSKKITKNIITHFPYHRIQIKNISKWYTWRVDAVYIKYIYALIKVPPASTFCVHDLYVGMAIKCPCIFKTLMA